MDGCDGYAVEKRGLWIEMCYGDEVRRIEDLSYRGLGKKHALGSQSVKG